MGKSKRYLKGIICLEAYWNPDVENRLSVMPILELAAKKYYMKSVHLTCNTIEELEFNLRVAPNKNGYNILYYAFHGFPGGIYMPGLMVEIETLSKLMGRRFSNWIVFFGSCATLRIERKRVLNFMEKTNALMIIGYRRRAMWIESSAIDLLLLDLIQQYKNMRRFWTRFRKTYKGLIRATGLEVFHRER